MPQDEHPAYRNDIIDIIPDGRIMFDRMSDEPGGELHRQDIMLNSTNVMRMKGFWDLMPNVSGLLQFRTYGNVLLYFTGFQL